MNHINRFQSIIQSKESQFKLLTMVSPSTISSEVSINNFDELLNSVSSGQLKHGDLVKIDACFSNYGQTYFPDTYMPTIPDTVAFEDDKQPRLVSIAKNTKIPFVQGKMQFKVKCFQLPVENIPPAAINNTARKIGFLYPKNFDGFIFEEDGSINKNILGQCCLKIPDKALPIILIYDHDIFSEFAESDVSITAQILFSDALANITSSLNNLHSIFQKHYLPNSSTHKVPPFCLLLSKHVGKIHTSKRRNVSGNIFIESHFDGLEKNKELREIFGKSTPDLPNIDIRALSYPPYKNHGGFFSRTDINCVFKEPATFSLFRKSVLTPQEITKTIHLIRIRYFYIIKNVYRLCKLKGIHQFSHPKILFLSDISFRTLFGLNSLYGSTAIDKHLKHSKERFGLKSWLFNS